MRGREGLALLFCLLGLSLGAQLEDGLGERLVQPLRPASGHSKLRGREITLGESATAGGDDTAL